MCCGIGHSVLELTGRHTVSLIHLVSQQQQLQQPHHTVGGPGCLVANDSSISSRRARETALALEAEERSMLELVRAAAVVQRERES